MIDRYSTPEMSSIWSDIIKLEYWVKIELLVIKALQDHNKIPKFELPNISDINISKLHADMLEEEKKTHHDIVAFINVLENMLGNNGKYIHYGLTSSDLCDTELALRINSASKLVINALSYLHDVLISKAVRYKYTIIMGRTHGKLAEPTTFGLVLLSFSLEIIRNLNRLITATDNVKVGKISGSVGTYAHISPEIEEQVLKELNLTKEVAAGQIIYRDRHAELITTIAIIGSSLERIATEIRNLSRSEIDEVSEPFRIQQKGSSSMPHKKNPIICENICGLSRLLRSYSIAAMENVALWHQRDISHSSVERIMFPDAFGLLYYMINKLTTVFLDLHIDEAKMRERVVDNTDICQSQISMLKYINSGFSRKEAHDLAQHNIDNKLQIDSVIEYHIKHVDHIFNEASFITSNILKTGSA